MTLTHLQNVISNNSKPLLLLLFSKVINILSSFMLLSSFLKLLSNCTTNAIYHSIPLKYLAHSTMLYPIMGYIADVIASMMSLKTIVTLLCTCGYIVRMGLGWYNYDASPMVKVSELLKCCTCIVLKQQIGYKQWFNCQSYARSIRQFFKRKISLKIILVKNVRLWLNYETKFHVEYLQLFYLHESNITHCYESVKGFLTSIKQPNNNASSTTHLLTAGDVFLTSATINNKYWSCQKMSK